MRCIKELECSQLSETTIGTRKCVVIVERAGPVRTPVANGLMNCDRCRTHTLTDTHTHPIPTSTHTHTQRRVITLWQRKILREGHRLLQHRNRFKRKLFEGDKIASFESLILEFSEVRVNHHGIFSGEALFLDEYSRISPLGEYKKTNFSSADLKSL